METRVTVLKAHIAIVPLTLLAVSAIAASCGDSQTTPRLSAAGSSTVATPSTAGSGGLHLTEVTIGQAFSPEACNASRLFGGQPSADSQGAVDEIWTESQTGGLPSRLIHVSLPDAEPSIPVPQKSPPTISAVRASGDWLTFTEYQQRSNGLSMSYWNVAVLDLANLHLTVVARGSGAALADLPDPDISSDGTVVWDEDIPTGKVLKVRNLTTTETRVLTLPVGTVPISPRIDGSTVVFADNQTDPNRATENWVSRGGHLMAYSLATGVTTQLDSTNDARRPEVSNSRVVWNAALPGPDGKPSDQWEVRWSPLGGARGGTLGIGDLAQISANNVLWFDYTDGLSNVFSFVTGQTYTMMVPGLSAQSSFAAPISVLCGTKIFYLVDTPRQLRVISVP